METPSNTQELNQPKPNDLTAQNEKILSREIKDIFDLMDMAKRIDQKLGISEDSYYDHLGNEF